MANLRDAVAAILADVTRAQNQANLLSRSLSETYRDDRLLHAFPVPSAQLSALTLDLRFAVVPRRRPPAAAAPAAGADSTPADGSPATPGGPPPADTPQGHALPPASAFLELGQRLADTVLEETAAAVPASAGTARAAMRDQLLAPETASELASQLGAALQRWYERLGRAAAEHPIETLVSQALREVGVVLREALLADTGLQNAFGGAAAVTAAVQTRAGRTVRDQLDAFVRHVRTLEVSLGEIPDFEVVLDNESLSRLPEHTLQSLTLRIGLDEYRWMVLENGHTEALVPASTGRAQLARGE